MRRRLGGTAIRSGLRGHVLGLRAFLLGWKVAYVMRPRRSSSPRRGFSFGGGAAARGVVSIYLRRPMSRWPLSCPFVTQLHVRAVFVRKSPRRIIMRPDGHSGVLNTPVDPEPLGGAFPPKQLSAEAAPTDNMSTAAAINRVLLIAADPPSSAAPRSMGVLGRRAGRGRCGRARLQPAAYLRRFPLFSKLPRRPPDIADFAQEGERTMRKFFGVTLVFACSLLAAPTANAQPGARIAVLPDVISVRHKCSGCLANCKHDNVCEDFCGNSPCRGKCRGEWQTAIQVCVNKCRSGGGPECRRSHKPH
jgi:hypothetical protein